MNNDIPVTHMLGKCLATGSICLAGWTLSEIQSFAAVIASVISIILGLIYLGEWVYKRFIKRIRPGDTDLAPLNKR